MADFLLGSVGAFASEVFKRRGLGVLQPLICHPILLFRGALLLLHILQVVDASLGATLCAFQNEPFVVPATTLSTTTNTAGFVLLCRGCRRAAIGPRARLQGRVQLLDLLLDVCQEEHGV